MQNNQRNYIEFISERLAWFTTLVNNENKANLTNTAILAEGFFKNFLNLLYDWHLENANEKKQNTPGIDLISDQERIVIQVSTNTEYCKIRTALSNLTSEKYRGYRLIILGIDQHTTKRKKKFDIPEEIIFNADTDIMTIPKLITIISNVNIEKLRGLYNMTYEYFSKLEADNMDENNNQLAEKEANKKLMGYCINFGMHCCRVFEIFEKGHNELKEIEPLSYKVNWPSIGKKKEMGQSSQFLNEIIRISNTDLQDKLKSGLFVKVFADAEFQDLFQHGEDQDSFVERYYKNTGHYFHILTKKQTEDNMKALFTDIEPLTAIIDICSSCVHVVIKNSTTSIQPFKTFLVNISTRDIRAKLSTENWDNSQITQLKEYIKSSIGTTFSGQKATTAIIIKDERFFMESMGYPLINDGTKMYIGYNDYAKHNKEHIYKKNFKDSVDKSFGKLEEQRRIKFYGFKEGHIILETIFEILGVEKIIPSDEPNILRSPFAHIFNVVLSGSTKPTHIKYMREAYVFFKDKLKVNVLHPNFQSIGEISQDSYQRHEQAIKKCDLLFVCNGDGYIGQQTKCDIYGASLLSKPIAYWIEPSKLDQKPDEYDFSSYVPHDNFKKMLEDYGYSCSSSAKGCIIGSFKKYYTTDIVGLIEKFNENGIDILSPQKSVIVDPNADFVILESDDQRMPEHEIQAKVFEQEKDSDFVYVWDPDGYVGRTTCYEIGRISERGTPIYYKEKPIDIPLKIPVDRIVDVENIINKFKKTE